MFIINLIKCPMCEKEISPNALSCPNCGEPMKNNEINIESNIENNIENDLYSVTLTNMNKNGMKVIKLLQEIKSCDISTALIIIKSMPAVIFTNCKLERAETLKERFINVGADVNIIKIENNKVKVLNEVIPIICPNFPEELSIGRQIANWTYDTVVYGVYKNNGDANDKIRNGKVASRLFTNGLTFGASFGPQRLDIHYSQVISAEEVKENELKDKSSIARAVVGGVVFGPLGAIIGGISGVGTKKNNTYYLAINYWDIETKTPVTISMGCNISSKRFIDRLYKEKNKIKICN